MFYIINDTADPVRVYPNNFNETSLVWEIESNQIFYRQKFQGSLVFGGQGLKADFNYLLSLEQTFPCRRLYINIYKDTYLYWQGYFATSNGAWDLDECTFAITPFVFDDYVDILDKADLQYNILNDLIGLPEVTTTYDNGVDTPIAYTHNRMFFDTIEYLADKLIPGIVVDSTFFTYVNNPVTLAINRYKYLTIAQKSDIKKPTATDNATVGMMSFNEIMDMCRCMNLYWDYVDLYGTLTLRVEHVSFWPQSAGLDIRTQKIARGTNKYKYLNESMPKYELFSWMEANHEDFIGDPIWYNSDCVNQNPETNAVEYNFSTVTTDLEYIIDRVNDPDDLGSSISNDGWVLLANELRGADLYVWLNVNSTLSAIVGNIDMSWYYLHKCFWMHDRQLIAGNMNGNAETFYTAKKVKQQECSIVYCDTDFNPSEYITTELGETYFSGEKAKVSQATIKPYGQIDLILLYGPDDNENSGITYSKVFFGVEVRDGTNNQSTVYGVLSEAAPVGGLTIQFKIQIKDAIGGTCKTDFKTIVFAAGEYKANSGNIAWCDPGGGSPYCVDEFTDVTDSVGDWVEYFEIDEDSICS